MKLYLEINRENDVGRFSMSQNCKNLIISGFYVVIVILIVSGFIGCILDDPVYQIEVRNNLPVTAAVDRKSVV
jgi:hypothetical protein